VAPPDTTLERLYIQYRHAVERCRGRIPDLDAVDDLLVARVTLYEHLVRSGWDPPEQVRHQLEVDALLLEQPHGPVPG
jgi:hypothetical protein